MFHFWVIRGGKKEILELIEKGHDINEAIETNGDTPLHIASRWSMFYIVKLLLDKGADVNKKDLSGHSPLYYAAKTDDDDIVRLLLSYGAVADDQETESLIVYEKEKLEEQFCHLKEPDVE
jgi:ankyrin repeat protein